MITRGIDGHDGRGTHGDEAIRDSLARSYSFVEVGSRIKRQRSRCQPCGQQNDGNSRERAPGGVPSSDRRAKDGQYDR